MRVASVAGVRHRLAGRPVQDSFAWAAEGDRLAVAVADGLGGVPDSDTTAARAALAAVEAALAPRPTPPLAGCQQPSPPPTRRPRGGGATTLVVAVLERSGEVSLARIGDSSAFLVGAHDGASWQELFAPPRRTPSAPAQPPCPPTTCGRRRRP